MEAIWSDSNGSLACRKRLGRMRRGMKLDMVIPIKSGQCACKSKSEDRRSEVIHSEALLNTVLHLKN